MNLFFDPSESEFQNLINNTSNDKPVHEVVVDYDGEVLIDPHLQQPDLDLDRFKVHIQLSEYVKKAIDKKPSRLRKLFNNILNAWNKNDYSGDSLALS